MNQNVDLEFQNLEARAAFSLVELLVVISIVALMVAIILPAVNASREAARVSQCKKNLHQIGVALLGYVETNNHLPSGHHASVGREVHMGWIPHTLPFLEQRTLHNRLDFGRSHTTHSDEIKKFAIPTIICPSTGPLEVACCLEVGDDQEGNDILASSYAATATETTVLEPNHNYYADTANGTGAIFVNSRTPMALIAKDGGSNTLLVTEGFSNQDTDSAITKLNTMGPYCPDGCNLGRPWMSGALVTTGFGINKSGPLHFESAVASEHPNGVNAVFCDGHVSFLSTQTDQEVLNGLTTTDGGETVTAPE